MLKEERQTWILNKLHTSGKVVVSHLAGELKVSEDTIRRDLLDLDQKGQLKRVFGGAIPLEKPVINFFDRGCCLKTAACHAGTGISGAGPAGCH